MMEENTTQRPVAAMEEIVLSLMISIRIALLSLHPTLETVVVMGEISTPRTVDGMEEIVISLMRYILIAMLSLHPGLETVFVMD